MKRVSAGVLKNGFRFYTQHDNKVHVSGIGVKAGSMHDPPGQSGICHLTEHIVAGYERDAELKLEEYQCGPDESINIRTDHVSTFYGHNNLLQRDYLFTLFDIFANGIRFPRFTKEDLKRERAAVLNEYYLRGLDMMEDTIDVLLRQAMYKTNPARKRIDCEPDDLSQMTLNDVRLFFRKYYVPNNMFAVILGPPFRKAKSVAERYFGDLPPLSVPPFSYDHSDIRPVLTSPKVVEAERKGIHQYHVAIGFPTGPFGSKDDEAIDVLAEIWRWRLREALRGENREWGKGTYRPRTFAHRSFAHGMLYATLATPSEDFARFGAEKIIAVANDLKEKWARNDELVTMSNKLYNHYVDAFNNSPGDLAERIIESAANGDEEMRRLNSYIGRLSLVGKKSVRRVANEYFTTPNAVIVILKPIHE